MRDSTREWIARVLLTVAALLPYAPLLTFSSIYVTDDVFTSDIFNGELPGLLLVGKMVAAGQLPLWSSQICSGYPLTVGDPLHLLTFGTLPAAVALDVYVIALLLVAAHGAYGLARRLGAARVGAVLAGVAFAVSGYMVAQLKHLGIVSTVVWLPWGLLLLDRAFSPSRPGIDGAAQSPPALANRVVHLGLFGLVFAVQLLAGFPQSAYICGLVYGGYSCFAAIRCGGRVRRVPLGLVLLGLLGAMCAIAAMIGAVRLLPLAEQGQWSDRTFNPGWEFSSSRSYTFRDALMFLVPYARGDASEGTYPGPGLFWENYGYVGVATFLLAIYAVVRAWWRPGRPHEGDARAPRPARITALLVIAVFAHLMVLGPSTPVFHLAWKLVPGMAMFRFPTRFLVVVDLVLAVLGGVGLSQLGDDLRRWLRDRPVSPRMPVLVTYAVCAATVLDLFLHQPRQNPFVSAERWLAPPPSVAALLSDAGPDKPRTFAPLHDLAHIWQSMGPAAGWTNVEPYFRLRDTLPPNIGVYWGIPGADCYAGLYSRWHADVWGTPGRRGLLVQNLTAPAGETFVAAPALARVMAIYGVTHVLTPFPLQAQGLEPAGGHGWAYVYRAAGRRARFVRTAKVVSSSEEAASLLTSKDFDPDAVVLLHDPPSTLPAPVTTDAAGVRVETKAVARVTDETSTYVRVAVNAARGGYLLLADSYYPGWQAVVDGKPAPIVRANISVRAVPLPAGASVVEFRYHPASFFTGLTLSLLGILSMSALLLGAVLASRRAAR